MPRYREIVRELFDTHEELFGEFMAIHQKYQLDKAGNQAEFNTKGEPVLALLREAEQKLCGKTERGNKAVFSSRLADKYWAEVKAFFPLIDFVGIEVVKPAVRPAPKEEVKPVPEPDPVWTKQELEEFEIKRLL